MSEKLSEVIAQAQHDALNHPLETKGFSSRRLDSGTDCLERILPQIADPDDRSWLIEQLEPAWRRRWRRLAERDALIVELAAHYIELVHGRAIADNLAKDLGRYQTSGWRRERGKPPAGDATRRLMHRILTLGEGKVVGSQRVREIRAGMAGNHRL